MNSGIYVIGNLVNKHFYIGGTKNFKVRWNSYSGHKNCLSMNVHQNRHLQNAWNKYGEHAFIFEILEECEEQYLDSLEQKYLDENVGRTDCYNIARFVDNPTRGVPKTEEQKEHLRNLNLGKKYGKKTRKKLRDLHVGRRRTEKQIQFLKETRRGIPKTDEHKQKIRDARKLQTVTKRTFISPSVQKIIELYNTKQYTQKELAKKYNVSVSWVCRNINNTIRVQNRRD